MVACPATLKSIAARPPESPLSGARALCSLLLLSWLDHRKQDGCFSGVRGRCSQGPLGPLGEGEGGHVCWALATSQACAGRHIMNSLDNL